MAKSPSLPVSSTHGRYSINVWYIKLSQQAVTGFVFSQLTMSSQKEIGGLHFWVKHITFFPSALQARILRTLGGGGESPKWAHGHQSPLRLPNMPLDISHSLQRQWLTFRLQSLPFSSSWPIQFNELSSHIFHIFNRFKISSPPGKKLAL